MEEARARVREVRAGRMSARAALDALRKTAHDVISA
jgi:hypothetical protein